MRRSSKQMLALVQEKAGGPLQVKQVPIPTPARGEVLVKMKYSPLNPSDLSMLQGSYAEKPDYPATPGIEGSGMVVGHGGGLLGALRTGKAVALTASHGRQGTWAEYVVTSASQVIPLGSIDMQQGAMMIVNPLTAVSFLRIARHGGHRYLVNTGAGGALGLMLARLAAAQGLKLLSLVRHPEQEEALRKAGSSAALASERDDYHERLIALMDKNPPTLVLDAVGGPDSALLLEYSAPGATLIPYAQLSEQPSCFEARHLLQKDKHIEGFFLGTYMQKQSINVKLKMIRQVKTLMKNELSSTIKAVYNIKQAPAAVEIYRQSMSGGKILLSF